jgi:hypothetical protein
VISLISTLFCTIPGPSLLDVFGNYRYFAQRLQGENTAGRVRSGRVGNSDPLSFCVFVIRRAVARGNPSPSMTNHPHPRVAIQTGGDNHPARKRL